MLDMHSQSVTFDQHALIEMALQPRDTRVQLSKAFFEIIGKPELKVRSRLALAHGGTSFVFLIAPSSDREARVSELGLRCLVVQCKQPDTQRVVGIATDQPGSSKIGHSCSPQHQPFWALCVVSRSDKRHPCHLRWSSRPPSPVFLQHPRDHTSG